MAQRLKLAVALSLVLLIALFSGCKARKPKSSTVVVHLLRNLNSVYGSNLDRRILDFEGSNPRVKSGQHIDIQSETSDYKEMLRKQSSNDDVTLIIMDSPDDAGANSALATALPQATNVCAGVQGCPAVIPAIIPAQVSGNDREAAQAFVDFLQKAP
jgi:ABC-type glycerol-3-phosphate transport system substrate-binding protein